MGRRLLWGFHLSGGPHYVAVSLFIAGRIIPPFTLVITYETALGEPTGLSVAISLGSNLSGLFYPSNYDGEP